MIKSVVYKLQDGTYTVTYTPRDVAHYTISVKYAGEEVPNGPFHVTTVPSGNASAVKPVSEYCITFLFCMSTILSVHYHQLFSSVTEASLSFVYAVSLKYYLYKCDKMTLLYNK